MNDKSMFEHKVPPHIQAGVVYLAILSVSLLCWLILLSGIMEIGRENFWIITLAFMLFYAIFNSVLSLAFEDQNKYFLHSLISYLALALLGGCTAWLFSGMTMDEAGTYRWLYMVFTFGYLVFLTIIRSMRKIVKMAKKQDNRLRGGD